MCVIEKCVEDVDIVVDTEVPVVVSVIQVVEVVVVGGVEKVVTQTQAVAEDILHPVEAAIPNGRKKLDQLLLILDHGTLLVRTFYVSCRVWLRLF